MSSPDLNNTTMTAEKEIQAGYFDINKMSTRSIGLTVEFPNTMFNDNCHIAPIELQCTEHEFIVPNPGLKKSSRKFVIAPGVTGPTHPAVLQINIVCPQVDCIDQAKRISSGKQAVYTSVIMLTIIEGDVNLPEGFRGRGDHYSSSSSSPRSIIDEINAEPPEGSAVLTHAVKKNFDVVKLNRSNAEAIIFNKREMEVLNGLIEGLTYKMIGSKYFIAVDTVRSYIRRIYEKLQVHSRSEAIVTAIRNRII